MKHDIVFILIMSAAISFLTCVFIMAPRLLAIPVEPQSSVFVISVQRIHSNNGNYMLHYTINGKAQTAFFCSVERMSEFIYHLEGL